MSWQLNIYTRTNAIVAKQCLWPDCVIKNNLKMNCFLVKAWVSFKANKMYTTAIFTHLVVKLYKNKTLRCSFIATADAAHKSTMYSRPTVACQRYQRGISAMVLKWSEMQQAGASETAAKSVSPCFTFGYWLQARIYKCLFHHHQLPHGA